MGHSRVRAIPHWSLLVVGPLHASICVVSIYLLLYWTNKFVKKKNRHRESIDLIRRLLSIDIGNR